MICSLSIGGSDIFNRGGFIVDACCDMESVASFVFLEWIVVLVPSVWLSFCGLKAFEVFMYKEKGSKHDVQ